MTATGAEALIGTLTGAGVDVCFTNPGTSEMHFVQAMDRVPAMRGVLAVFEGVATGAADGYARVTGRPAAVLLHLGPGLANGMANLHNARRAGSPLLCLVGAHATGHVRYDAPLQSDIEAAARTVSGWVHTSGTTRGLAGDAARAIAATAGDGGQIATLIVPADLSWETGGRPAAPYPAPPQPAASPGAVEEAAAALAAGQAPLLFLGRNALTERGLRAASRIAAAAGARLLAETFPARLEGGAGRPAVARLPYLPEAADQALAGTDQLILAGARAPVTFFGYPGRGGDLVPGGCAVTELAARLAPGTQPRVTPPGVPDVTPGPLNPVNLANVIATELPVNAIIVDEAATSGFGLPQALAGAPPHTLLALTGGSIGQGLPVAVGAAVAAPDRPVLAIEADGSSLYTIQSLWTMAREKLNVTTVLVNNAAYAVLRIELARTGAGAAGPRAARLLDLSDPVTDFTRLSEGFGVPARRATTAEELASALRWAQSEPGPHLIEAIVPPVA
jgi:acetolactate synthase-1/2/3 large subunit